MDKISVRQIKEPEIAANFNIRKIGTLLSGKDMVQDLHRHDFFFVLVLEKGAGEHIIDFISYPINNYSVFFMRPGQVHQLELKKGSTGYLMEFNTEFYAPLETAGKIILRKASNRTYCRLNPVRFKKALSVLDSIFREHAEKQEKYKEAILANFELFLIELIRQSQNPSGLVKGHNRYSQQRLEDFLELLETHFANKKNARHYAGLLNLTTYQLNAITRETVGKTCSELIKEHILLEAKRLLLATGNKVNQISYQLGYEDVSYFVRFFKKNTGYTPETFRENFK
ncbi:MAG TPA: AraC family transcriptional regulator [Chitinophagales bacterium]|nr:AraC family transcriptional regulator [Chitinophagales bacterium]